MDGEGSVNYFMLIILLEIIILKSLNQRCGDFHLKDVFHVIRFLISSKIFRENGFVYASKSRFDDVNSN